MSTKTSIEWTKNDDGTAGRTWNPVVGCDKVSEGCGLPRFDGDKSGGCYAENIARRFAGGPAYPNGFKLTLKPERLSDPLTWRTPTRVFVNSMSDLSVKAKFDEILCWAYFRSPEWICPAMLRARQVSCTWGASPVAGFYVDDDEALQPVVVQVGAVPALAGADLVEPEGRVGLVGAQDAAHCGTWAEVRIPALLETPAAVRFLSAEPLLGALDLRNLRVRSGAWIDALSGDVKGPGGEVYASAPGCLDLVIAGAESGAGAREMDLDWVRSLRDQCVATGRAFFFKQDAIRGKKVPTPVLDGRTWTQMPAVA